MEKYPSPQEAARGVPAGKTRMEIDRMILKFQNGTDEHIIAEYL